MMAYAGGSSREYWDFRAEIYYTSDVMGRNILKFYVDKIQPISLIELGCGTGILFKLFKFVPRVSALDFSPKMLERARRRCERHNYNYELFQHDITEPLKGRWDLAVSRTCLMHIPPNQIEQVVTNIANICSQALIFEFWQLEPPKELSAHNWLHDYTTLFENAGFRSEDFYVRGDQPQALFWFKKEK